MSRLILWAGLSWSRPDDPARARTQQPGHRAYIDAATLRAGLAVEADPREVIRDYLVQRVEHGVVRSRADVVEALKEAGLDVPRQGKSYVTAHDPETGKRWRLKGALYEHDFTQSDLTSRFQRRLENERVEIETTAARELTVLGENLRGVAQSALSTIDADTAAWIGRMRGMFLRGWLWPLMVGLMLSLGICVGSWAGTRWLWTTLEQQIETLAVLRVDIEQARQTLTELVEVARMRPKHLERCQNRIEVTHEIHSARPRVDALPTHQRQRIGSVHKPEQHALDGQQQLSRDSVPERRSHGIDVATGRNVCDGVVSERRWNARSVTRPIRVPRARYVEHPAESHDAGRKSMVDQYPRDHGCSPTDPDSVECRSSRRKN